MRAVLVLWVCLFHLWSMTAQVVDEINQPAARVNGLLDKAWDLRDEFPDSCIYFSRQALDEAITNNLVQEEIKARNYLGVGYRNVSLYPQALESYLEALALSEELDHQEQRGYSLINIANIYSIQKDFEEGKRYLSLALDQAEKLGNKAMEGYCFYNLAKLHSDLGDYDQADEYYDQALEARMEIGDEYGLVAVKQERAEVMRLKGQLDSALREFTMILPSLEGHGDIRGLARTHTRISRIYLEIGQTDNALSSAETALVIAEQLELKYEKREVLQVLAEIHFARGDFKDAFDFQVKYTDLNNEIFSEERIRQVEQLKTKAEIESKASENLLLRERSSRQRLFNYLLMALAMLFLASAFIYFRAFRHKKLLSERIKAQHDQMEADKSTIEQQRNKLRELDNAKSQFFSNVSHDLRTPLSLIIGNLELAREDEESYFSPMVKQSIETSHKNAMRLVYLADEINDITRLEEGKLRLKMVPVRITAFIKILCDMFQSSARHRGVDLQFVSELAENVSVSLDSGQFEKVYYNLISNAIRFCENGAIIKVTLSGSDDQIKLTFQDTGAGIDSNSLPHIFDRFYQAGLDDQAPREGMGIGLALVKELVNLHQGKISVSSQLGIGTTFEILLPTDKSAEGHTAVISDYIHTQQDTANGDTVPGFSVTDGSVHRPRVLVVDDHIEIRYYIRQILEEEYDVKEASHGLEALEVLAGQKIDLIVTDLMMPWMDGFELIESIQNNPSYSRIPLLIVSARISDQDRERALIKGINNFIQKPFDKKELVLRINNLLSASSRKEEFDSIAARQNLESYGDEILKKVESFIKDNIDDTNLGVLQLGDAIAASERQVYRLIKKVTGKTPYEYITEVRLQYAEYLIRKSKVRSASEAARNVGIKNVTTFNKMYEKRFGVRPSELFENS